MLYMKKVLLFTFVFVLKTYSNAQDYTSSIYWDNPSIINPAFSGFNQKLYTNVQSSLSHSIVSPNQSFEISPPTNFSFDFGYKFEKINSGLGINYATEKNEWQGWVYSKAKNSNLNVNYNYQFYFSENKSLSIGTSLGIIRNYYFVEPWFNCVYCIWSPTPDAYNTNLSIEYTPTVNLGVAYKYKTLTLGLSSTNLTNFDFKKSNKSMFRVHYLTTIYDAKISDKWTYVFSILLARSDGYAYFRNEKNRYVDYGITLTNRVMYNDIFSFGIYFDDNVFDHEQTLGLLLGWRIKNKFDINYAISTDDLSFDNWTEIRHQLSLSYFIK